MILIKEKVGNYVLNDQVTNRSIVVEEAETSKIVFSCTVISISFDEARIINGSGCVTKEIVKSIGIYLHSKGYSKYHWERRLSDGTFKQVTKKMRIKLP